MRARTKIPAQKPAVKTTSFSHRTQQPNLSQSPNSPIDNILYLQRTIGNQAVQRLIKSGALQKKLRIGKSNDIYEQEANRVADQVMAMPMPDPWLQRQPEAEGEEAIQTKALADQITPLIQRQFEEIEKRKKAVKKACDVCREEWEIPDIIKKLAPNILAIHPQRVEQFKPLNSEMNLMIAYPRISERPLMSEGPIKGKEEFEYINVKVALPFTINRPDAPIIFLGRSGGGYVVKSRHAWLRAHCGIEDPVIFNISSAEHKKNLRPLATQYQEVFQQFKLLGGKEKKNR